MSSFKLLQRYVLTSLPPPCVRDERISADKKLQYGVVVLRNTGLTDEKHIALSRRFGELDDVTPYISAGRKHRLKYPELFDVSNVEIDGTILNPESPRGQANKVKRTASATYADYLIMRLGQQHFSR